MPTSRSIWEDVDEIELLCSKIRRNRCKKLKATEEDYKKVREKYDPRKQNKRIKVLFIGESPPGNGTYFYCANSKLYHATKEAFEKAYNNKRLSHPDFLECFKHLGCYLKDFFDGQPCKKVNKPCQEFEDQMNKLIQQIKEINPEFIIVVHERVCYCVMLALLKANLKIEVRCLPFPRTAQGGLSYNAYVNQLAEIIQKELIPRGIFPEKLPQPPC